jgi:voltage-gated potassium channel
VPKREPTPPDEIELRWTNRFEWPVLIAAAFVIPVLVLQNEKVTGILGSITHAADYVIWSIFALEVIVMMVVTTDRRRWARDHWLDIIVTIATPPFLLAALEPFQVGRLLRLTRLLRLAPILRKAFSPGGIKTAMILSALSLGAGALIYNSLTGVSFGKGMLISAFSLLSGNTGPNRVPDVSSQIATIVLRIIGILVVVFFTGAVAERFVRADIEGTAEAEADLDEQRNELLMAEIRSLQSQMTRIEVRLESAGMGTEFSPAAD